MSNNLIIKFLSNKLIFKYPSSYTSNLNNKWNIMNKNEKNEKNEKNKNYKITKNLLISFF